MFEYFDWVAMGIHRLVGYKYGYVGGGGGGGLSVEVCPLLIRVGGTLW